MPIQTKDKKDKADDKAHTPTHATAKEQSDREIVQMNPKDLSKEKEVHNFVLMSRFFVDLM